MSWFDSLTKKFTTAVSQIDLDAISKDLQEGASKAIHMAEGALESIATTVKTQVEEFEKEREVSSRNWWLTGLALCRRETRAGRV